MYSRYPQIVRDDKKFIEIIKSDEGIVLWGPYQTLAPGTYVVEFEIEPEEYEKTSQACCKIEVTTDAGKNIVLQQLCSVGYLIECQGKIIRTFKITKESRVEFRVWAVGGTTFRVGCERRCHSVALRDRENSIIDHSIYARYPDRIIALETAGVQFSAKEGALIANAEGVRSEVRSLEDFQVLAEVFTLNEYNVLPPWPVIAIDIGMNNGLVSLSLAKKTQIEMVYSYEPFQVPFKRAARNFELNAAFSGKIHAANVGLADKDEVVDVMSLTESTIGVSIRGAGRGTPERIQIKDAASELRPKFASARKRGLRVIVKMDCEGSEFAIFDSLKSANLLGQIDGMMIEWHKWWAKDKTQADLIAPLLEAGFLVFDRTNPNNPHAGFLIAVRTDRDRSPG